MNNIQPPLSVQLRGVQEKWAHNPLLQPLSLHAGQLANTLFALLQNSIFYLKQSDPTYLRGKHRAVLLYQRQHPGCSPKCLGLSPSWSKAGSTQPTPAFRKAHVTHFLVSIQISHPRPDKEVWGGLLPWLGYWKGLHHFAQRTLCLPLCILYQKQGPSPCPL